MKQPNPLIKSIRESSGIRLCVLFGCFFILLLLSGMIGIAIGASQTGTERTHMLIMSSVQSILAFCIPAFLAARFCSDKPVEWLKLSSPPGIKALLGVIAVYCVSLPAMEWLVEWNAGIHLPESMASLEQVLRQWEENAENMSVVLLESQGFVSVFTGILVIGVLTGFGEELFFRGALQGILVRSKISRHLAVWTAAFIFSTLHFQFFGFIPRLLMGAFFGYLLIWTGSLWVPVFAHALNNSMVVIISAVTGETAIKMSESAEGASFMDHPVAIIGSVLLTVLFLTTLRGFIFNKESKWQKRRLQSVSES